MKRYLMTVATILLISFNGYSTVRIKDVANVEGVRDNQIFGYGLVIGLNGTGDKDQTKFTTQSLVNMLERMGVTVNKNEVKVKNVAAVMVTAKLPPFSRAGQQIDVTLSSIGDAKSLEGGTLLLTPLAAPNGQIYAVAQGPVSVGGLSINAGGAGVTKNHPTAGRVPNGATVEKEIDYQMDTTGFNIFFSSFSLSDVVNAKSAINNYAGYEIASITSPSNIRVNLPSAVQDSYFDFLDTILNLEIEPENFAKVIVDERTGTIVMGSNVKVSTVAVAHGNMTITITNHIEVSQPEPFSGGQTVVTNQQTVEVAEDKANLMVVPEAVTISDLVKALNAIGVTPRDLISILQSIKAAGALHAHLEVI